MLITEKSISLRIENNVMAKKFVQKLYKMYTKIIRNTKFVYICIQRLYKSNFV